MWYREGGTAQCQSQEPEGSLEQEHSACLCASTIEAGELCPEDALGLGGQRLRVLGLSLRPLDFHQQSPQGPPNPSPLPSPKATSILLGFFLP